MYCVISLSHFIQESRPNMAVTHIINKDIARSFEYDLGIWAICPR